MKTLSCFLLFVIINQSLLLAQENLIEEWKVDKMEIEKDLYRYSYRDTLLEGSIKLINSRNSYFTVGNYTDGFRNGHFKYFSNGILINEGEYLNGRQHGTWKDYYQNELSSVRHFNSGIPDGEQFKYSSKIKGFVYEKEIWRNGVLFEHWQFHNNRELASHYKFNETDQTAVRKSYFDDGTPESVKKFKSNKYDGPQEYFFGNGKKQKVEHYKNGIRSGESLFYYENGTLKSRYTYSDGNKEGLQEEYYSNGQLSKQETIKSQNRDRRYSLYYANGNPKEITEYKKGKLHGKQETYDLEGQLRNSTNWENGYKNGQFVSFSAEGVKVEEGNFADGFKEGIWKTYYRDGSLRTKSSFKGGILEEEEEFKQDKKS